MKRYKRCIHGGLILSACIISVLVSVSTVGETWGMGRIIDILEIKDWNVFIYLLLFVAGMVVVQYIGNTLNIFIKGRALQKIRFNLQTLLGEKTLDMDYMTAKEYKSGELNFMFLSDVEKISGFWQTFMDGIGGAVTAVVSIFLCGYISWKFLAAALAAFPVVLGLTGIVNRKVHGAVNEARAGGAASASIFLNDIQNQMLIQSYQLQKYAEEKYAKVQAEERVAMAKEMSVRGQVGASNRITGAIPYLTIFVTGAVLIWHNEISLGDFFAFSYIFSNIQSVTNIPEIISAHKIYQVSSEKIMDFINKAEPVVKEEERTEEIPCGERSGRPVENGLYLENLTFSYHDDKKILDQVNLGLKPGDFAAVVGKSGSGKSTLFHLLVGLYVPGGGRLYLHTDGKDLSAEEYRDRTGVVFQDNYLFAGTVAENITLGRHCASEMEIEKACRKAGIWKDIEAMPDGLQTFVGERGSRLSGGQRQRVCIARAFLKNPYILIMDEPSASLDPANEREIMEQLRGSMKDGIFIMITHRISTMRYANRILEVKDGKISGKDGYEEYEE